MKEEKDMLAADMKAWYRQIEELYEECHPEAQGRVTARSAVQCSGSSRMHRDALVAITTGKKGKIKNLTPLMVSVRSAHART